MWTIGTPGNSSVLFARQKVSASGPPATMTLGRCAAYFSRR
jgi:hypothetical protein